MKHCFLGCHLVKNILFILGLEQKVFTILGTEIHKTMPTDVEIKVEIDWLN